MISARFSGSVGSFFLDVDLSAPGRGVTALFGHSGCGKTTVLRCLAGLERLAGHLALDGDTVWQDDARFVPTHRRAVGYVFQEASLFPHLSVVDNLRFGERRAREPRPRIAFDEVVPLLGLDDLLARRPDRLSGGERQRVAIGRALLSQPRMLLMDEPLSALDAISKDEILPYLERLHDRLEIPVVYVSHDLAEVERLADRLVLMRDGRVMAEGPLSELLSDPDLPLMGRRDAAVVLAARLAGVDRDFGLCRYRAGGSDFLLPLTDGAGADRRLRIQASDVSLCRTRPEATTILNVLPGRVESLTPDGAYGILVLLRLGEEGTGERLLARISRKSAADLALVPGDRLFAQVKAVALLDKG